MRIVQEQTVVASPSSAVLAPTRTAAEDSCRQNRDEVDETASTIVPDQLEAERSTDFEDSEDEQEPVAELSLGQVTKLRWAELTSNSEAEEPTSTKAVARQARLRWADLQDSDEETSAPQAPSSSSSSSSPKEAAVAAPSSSSSSSDSASAAPRDEERPSAVPAAAVPGRDSTGTQASRESQGRSGKWANQWGTWQSEQQPRAQQGSKAASWRNSRSYNKQWWGSEGGAGNWQQAWTSPQQTWNDSHTAAKPQCQFFMGIAEEPTFKVTRKVLGPHGQHMKDIAEATGAKLRLRGKGSGFLEGEDRRESTDELMLCVSAQDWTSYQEAVRHVTELLNRVYDQYKTFCRRSGADTPSIEIRMNEGPRPGSR